MKNDKSKDLLDISKEALKSKAQRSDENRKFISELERKLGTAINELSKSKYDLREKVDMLSKAYERVK